MSSLLVTLSGQQERIKHMQSQLSAPTYRRDYEALLSLGITLAACRSADEGSRIISPDELL